MYSTMKAYGMKRKTTNGQKHFVTDDVNERSLTKGEEKKKEKYVKGMKKRKKNLRTMAMKQKRLCTLLLLKWRRVNDMLINEITNYGAVPWY